MARAKSECVNIENKENRMSSIGYRLMKAREGLHISQAELARQMGVGRSVLNKWESGQRSMSAEKIAIACQVLGVNPAGILGVRVGQPLPSVQRRLMLVMKAHGTGLAMRRLEINRSAMSAVMEGTLVVPNSNLEGLAKDYGVAYAWLLTGSPQLWTPSIEENWSSRLKLFRFSIGGLRDAPDSRALEGLFMDGENSNETARTLMTGVDGVGLPSLVKGLQFSHGAWSRQVRLDFPFDFSGLCEEQPVFRPIECEKYETESGLDEPDDER